MKFLIHETLRTLNTDDVFEFGLSEISRSQEYDDLYEGEVVFRRNKKEKKHKVRSLTEFDVVRNFITYVGINLRAIAKKESVEFDLYGMTLDEYIPMNKTMRDIWDE